MYEGPKYLYKYRPFDEYTFDMLEKDYVFLCQAKELDDESECVVTCDEQKILNALHYGLGLDSVDKIFEYIRPYSTDTNLEKAKELFLQAATRRGKIDNRLALEVAPEMQALVPDVDVSPIINMLVNIPEQLDNLSTKDTMYPLMEFALDAREEVGVCSLAESSGIEKMWERYANNSTGYCIEYCVDDYTFNKDILPVVYEDNKETDLLNMLLGSFMGYFIEGMTNGLIKTDKSHYVRLLLTKAMEWEYQQEWRIVGDANMHATAPQINRIFLGKNIRKSDEIKIQDFAKRNNIVVIKK